MDNRNIPDTHTAVHAGQTLADAEEKGLENVVIADEVQEPAEAQQVSKKTKKGKKVKEKKEKTPSAPYWELYRCSNALDLTFQIQYPKKLHTQP